MFLLTYEILPEAEGKLRAAQAVHAGFENIHDSLKWWLLNNAKKGVVRSETDPPIYAARFNPTHSSADSIVVIYALERNHITVIDVKITP